APDGPVYQAGTLSGNPVAMTAGLTTLSCLEDENFYTALNDKSAAFLESLKARLSGKDIVINHAGSMFTLFFTPAGRVESFEDVKKCDLPRFARFFRHMLAHNIYISPSQFEANFISTAHTERELTRFVAVAAGFT
ncbi:MAG: aspartate aminotransferase family protein, partial [Tannerella sp.]|nr:aspartate aminotransferase family protein [Tannerella sp.]